MFHYNVNGFGNSCATITNTGNSVPIPNAGVGGYVEWRNLSVTPANPFNADVTGAAIVAGFGDNLARSFDGNNDEIDLTGAEVNSTKFPDLFSEVIFAQKDTWDATKRWLVYDYVDANNYFGIAST